MISRLRPLAVALLLVPAAALAQEGAVPAGGEAAPAQGPRALREGPASAAGGPSVLFPGAAECAAALERARVLSPVVADSGNVEALRQEYQRRAAAESANDSGREALQELGRQRIALYTTEQLVADRCPDLAASFAGSRGAGLLVGGTERLTPKVVLDAATFSAWYAARPSAGPGLSSDGLGAAAARLRPFEPEAAQSLWDRIGAWLRDLLAPADAEDGGLADWLRFDIPSSWVDRLLAFAGGAIVLAALAVLGNELRQAGVFSGGRTRRCAGPSRPATETGGERFVDWRQAAPHRRPGLLLAAILERLHGRGFMTAAASLTHRELAGAARPLSIAQQASLGVVASAAERTTFGGWRPRDAELAPVLKRGEALLEDIARNADPEPGEAAKP